MILLKKQGDKNNYKVSLLGLEIYSSKLSQTGDKKRRWLYGLYSSRKNIISKKYRCLGFTLYSERLNDPTETKGKCLLGIISFRDSSTMRKVKFLGIPFLSIVKQPNKWIYKLFGIKIKEKTKSIPAPKYAQNLAQNLKDLESEELFQLLVFYKISLWNI